MCCCGCTLAILMEESRLAASTGAGVPQDQTRETTVAVARARRSAWKRLVRWLAGPERGGAR